MRLGIRYRLLLPLTLLVLGVVGATLWSAQVAARRAEDRIVQQVRGISQTIAQSRFPLTANVLLQIKSLSGAEFLFVHPSGSKLSTFDGEPIAVPEDSLFQNVPSSSLGPRLRVQNIDYRCERLELKEPHRDAGGRVYIYFPDSLVVEAIADAERPSFLALGFGVLAILLTFGIAQRLVGRIGDLQKRTRQIADGSFTPMPLPRTDDELRDLAASINEMAERLNRWQEAVGVAERLQLTSQLSRGLAHQLRNGVTGARLALQVHLAEHPDADPEALTVALRQLSMMEANLRRFLDLGRQPFFRSEMVSLRTVAEQAVDLYRPQCRHSGITLSLSAPEEEILIEGDRDLLGDVLINLIGNAVEAVGHSGKVRVDIQHDADRARIEVSDSGPGPEPRLADKLFEPFVTGKPEGIGLGLAVARHSVQAHGGELSWQREGDRTVFRVDLPRNRTSESPEVSVR